jgi:carboxyl-terminal processing protease
MEKRVKVKKLLLRILSYILVAAMTSFATLMLMGRSIKLGQLERIVKTYFVGEVDDAAMTDVAAEAMISSLGDRWSYYVSADEYSSFNERKTNSYVGIGITIQSREDGIGFDVVQVEPDGPAYRAGMLPGDILIEIEGTSLENVDSEVPVNLIRGQAGTEVHMVLLRDGERLELTARRAKVQSVVADGQMMPGEIGYVRINNFNTNCAKQTIAIIDDLTAQGAKALVFDVRNNGGGYVHEMNQILDYLLPEGDLFRSVGYNGRESVDKSDADCLDLPMAVLVNGYSYSAAEFFAAALREYDWATIVGQPTTGKGYFQNTIELSDGSAVNLSVGKYYTPKGVSLAEVGGLVPKVLVEVDAETEAQIYSQLLPPEEDPQLQAAIKALQE